MRKAKNSLFHTGGVQGVMTRDQLLFKSVAKINLTLEILGHRDDGFHDLRSVFQTIELSDELEFSLTPEKIVLDLDCPGGDEDFFSSNIVHRTAVTMRHRWKVKKGVRICLRKKIPIGSGLGGGSSNAAVTIRGLDELWGLGLSPEDILTLSAEIGSDVPFFYYGGTVLVEGRGERLSPMDDIEPYFIVIVKPAFSLSSSDAYRWWDERESSGRPVRRHDHFVSGRSLSGLLHNDFEDVLFPRYPVLRTIKEALLTLGCSDALLSGSGSCIFGLVEDHDRAQEIAGKIRGRGLGDLFLTRTSRRKKVV